MVLLIIVIALLAIGAFVALLRGLLAFASDGDLIKSGGDAYLKRAKQQNRMMTQRVMFQALAVVALVLLAFIFSAH